MLFNSSVFIFTFLPVVVGGYLLLQKAQNTRLSQGWLFVASLFFYGWWDWRFAPLLLALIAFNYIVGARLIEKQDKKILCLGVAVNILLLVFFKYTGFLADNINGLFGTALGLPAIIQPLGISFLLFLQISFLADCHAGKITAKPELLKFSLFTVFFPKLAQGPITRYTEFAPQLEKPKSVRMDMIAAGLSLFALGLFKKVFLADTLGGYANPLFEAASARPLAMVEAWVAMLSYTFQIYFDFSGYSDMALGIAKMFGLRLPLNFFSPYKAKSIVDFWRRWHMTLSRFLRDYLYIPLGGNRKGAVRRHINLMLTMLLGGLWHGASWSFVIWGGLHGAYLVVNHLCKNRLPVLCAQPLTFLCVAVAWIFFRASDATTAFSIVKSLVQPDSTDLYRAFFTDASPLRQSFGTQAANLVLPLLIACAVGCFALPNTLEIMRRGKMYVGGRHGVTRKKNALMWCADMKWGILSGTILGICLLKVLYEPSNVFLYFQF